MDDTPTRVTSEGDVIGRSTEGPSPRSDESTRGYASSGPTQSSDVDPEVEQQTRQIRRDIEQTREELTETIDAIQEKLRPANIVSNATDTIKHATTEKVKHMAQSASDAASSMMYGRRYRSGGFVDSLRDNPYPAALIGIGAAWLLFSSRSDSDEDSREGRDYRSAGRMSDRDQRARDYRYGSDREDLENFGSEYGTDYSRSGYSRSRSAYDQGSDAPGAGGLLQRVRNNPVPAALAGIGLGWLAFSDGDNDESRDQYGRSGYSTFREESDDERSTTSQLSETVSDAASNVTEGAQALTSRAQEYASDAKRQATRTGRRAQNQLHRMTRENPLAVGAGALLLGAIVGLAIPETERENELLGDTRDSVIDKAQQMARSATERAQDAAADLVGDAASRIVGGKTE